jgi:hypothetical protein
MTALSGLLPVAVHNEISAFHPQKTSGCEVQRDQCLRFKWIACQVKHAVISERRFAMP